MWPMCEVAAWSALPLGKCSVWGVDPTEEIDVRRDSRPVFLRYFIRHWRAERTIPGGGAGPAPRAWPLRPTERPDTAPSRPFRCLDARRAKRPCTGRPSGWPRHELEAGRGQDKKGRSKSKEQYIGLPHNMVQAPAFRALGGAALKVDILSFTAGSGAASTGAVPQP